MRPPLAALLAATACALASSPRLAAQSATFLDRRLNDWLHDLSDPNPAVRRGAAFAVGRMGPAGAPAAGDLVVCLKGDAEPAVRDMAAAALGDVVLALRGADGGVWVQAGQTLRKSLAEDPDPRVRRSAAYALGAFGSRGEPAHDELRRALRDAAPGVRRSAAWALGRQGGEAGEGTAAELAGLFKDKDPLVRRDAIAALAGLGPEGARAGVPSLLSLIPDEPDEVVRRTALEKAVGLVGPKDRPHAALLYPLLRDDDPAARLAAALTLGNIGGTEAAPALPALREALRGKDDAARDSAAAALSNVGTAAAPAVPDLARALREDRSPLVRRNAALALAHAGKEAREAVQALVDALRPSEVREVRVLAAEAISRVGYPANKEAIPALLKVIRADADGLVRHRCTFALMAVDDLRGCGAADALTAVLAETTPETTLLRYEAACTLASRLGPDAPDRTAEVLVDFLKNKNIQFYEGSKTRATGAPTEGSRGASGLETNHGEDARYVAAQCLGVLGRRAARRPEVLDALREAAKDENPKVRDRASEALKKLQK